jgi:hypothetical protein
MSDLLIRNIKPQLKRRLAQRARKHRQSLSAEAQDLLERGLSTAPSPEKDFGDWLYSLVREEDRGDDLIFEIPGGDVQPPELE